MGVSAVSQINSPVSVSGQLNNPVNTVLTETHFTLATSGAALLVAQNFNRKSLSISLSSGFGAYVSTNASGIAGSGVYVTASQALTFDAVVPTNAFYGMSSSGTSIVTTLEGN